MVMRIQNVANCNILCNADCSMFTVLVWVVDNCHGFWQRFVTGVYLFCCLFIRLCEIMSCVDM
jgi:hypothetical protein